MATTFRLPPPPTATPANPLDNYMSLRNSYFNMINNKDNNDDAFFAAVDPQAPALVPLPGSAAANPNVSPFVPDQTDMDSFRELLELCGMTPEGTPALGNFDGSPMDETPLFTPALDMFGATTTPYLDDWDVSPALGGDMDTFDAFPPLFVTNTKNENNHPAVIGDQSQLFTLPTTPALAPAELAPTAAASSNNARSKGPTGFRKGTTPASLVPMDAPTQPRQYLGESKTSRKEVPSAFQNKARKRQHEEMLDDEELPDDIQDAIAAKRRLNTLAARRSRARKAQTAQENEDRINGLTEQVARLQQELVRVTAERDAYRSQLGLH